MIDYKKFVENSRKWLENYIISNQLQSLVIGISGGIDSTVSCAIASPVCEKLNILFIGRSLPCNTNKLGEINSAQLVGEAFCNDFKEVSIEDMYTKIANDITDEEGTLYNIQLGNIKARLRMIYLRNLASMHGGVVLDNDNFTEWNLGFWTVGGDSPMDINLGLHYLWKTEIYELAKYLLTEYEILAIQTREICLAISALKESIALTPTDGNGVSKSDCEQFGLDNYEQVDDVLKTMYFPEGGMDNIKYKNEYLRLIDSYNEQGVDKVMVRHQNSAFKRMPSPIMPKLEDLI